MTAAVTIHLVSLGCAKNLVDSENMMGRLEAAGHRFTAAPEAAEVIIVNTCGFIESAANESIDTILTLARYKQEGACRRLLVLGCLSQRHREDLVRALPEVDFFLGTNAIAHIEMALEETAGRSLFSAPGVPDIPPETPTRRLSTWPTAYLKVSEGCSRHCTYCIIPRLRGPQRSRAPEAVVDEARRLISQDIKELVLIGQDTTAYGADLSEPASLARLLEQLAGLAPQVWIRFLYGHPLSFTAELPEVMARHANICPYLDIPIQHASDAVLRRMGRNYSQADLRRLFAAVRTRLPEVALRTTVIVGFPGESENDFAALLRFMEDIRFDHLGGFTYSDAADLAAHRLPRHVSGRVTRNRLNTLMDVQMAIAAECNSRHVGRRMPVLVEGCLDDGPLQQGRSMLQAPDVDGIVRLEGPARAPGDMVMVQITEAQPYDLTGVILA